MNQCLIQKQEKKIFVIEDEMTQKSIIIENFIHLTNNYTNVNHILQQFCPSSYNKIKIYSPNENKFIELSSLNCKDIQIGMIPNQFLKTSFIMIRYSALGIDQETISAISEPKQRSKERTIGETIQLVRKWRKLHQRYQESPFKRKMNLQQAADMLKISKKSLDDYFYQLRLGQVLKFPFNLYLNQKIGFLRNYIKKKKSSAKLQKYPKKLNIISDCFEQYHEKECNSQRQSKEITNQKLQNNEKSFSYEKINKLLNSSEINESEDKKNGYKSWQEIQKLRKSYEQKYYQSFQFFDDQHNNLLISSTDDLISKDNHWGNFF